MNTNIQKVYKAVSRIPRGKVSTYSDIGRIAGIRSPRAVGSMLHKNKNSEVIPCHRVVHQDGSLAEKYAFGGMVKQEEKLKYEGVEITGSRVNMVKHLWCPDKINLE